MRVLLIDQSKERMERLRKALAGRIPDVEVTEYDAEQQGRPLPGFDWSLYDVAFFQEDLGAGQSGLRWLREFRTRPGFPASVAMADLDNTSVIDQANRAGADAVIGTHTQRPGKLLAAMKAAMARHASQEASQQTSQPSDNTPQLIQELRSKDPETRLRPRYEYRGLRLIGQGGMSRVYLAERVQDGRTVVLKIVETASAEPAELHRFIHEAELISSISSPYVVEIFERAFTNKYGFIAMEFFPRGDLKQRIEHGIPPEDALLYLLQIAYALEAIHEVGIVHRDVKPANIMFRADDSLALADFGVSKHLHRSSELTAPGMLVGTLYYMSPEQVNSGPVDARSDLYSMGILLFEMLMKRKPFVGSSPSRLLDQHLYGDIPRLPPEHVSLQPLLDRLLAKEPEHRFQSASDLVTYLRSEISG